MAYILNSVIGALNVIEGRVPKHLIIIPDQNLIDDLDLYDYGVYKALAAIVNWLTQQIDICVRRKHLQILERKPGAIFGKEPTIIYVQMSRKIASFKPGSKAEIKVNLMSKFNGILNEAVARQNNHVMVIRSCNTLEHFDKWGNLSVKGKVTFWHEMDDLMERFDSNKIQLMPKIPPFPRQRNHHWQDKQF